MTSSYIPGLTYIENYISAQQEKELIEEIDCNAWNADLKRRVQHHGYKYDYKTSSITEEHFLGNLPAWLYDIGASIADMKPNQVIINEYLPGQGIAPHIDHTSLFADTICSLSLNSSCVMKFTKDTKEENMLLEPRSMLVLKSDARYLWKHSIPSRKNDNWHGVKMPRSRRISITFRRVANYNEF